MKLNSKQTSIQPQISEAEIEHPRLPHRPNPPTPEAVEKAQFVDKTYKWKGSAAYKAANVQPSN